MIACPCGSSRGTSNAREVRRPAATPADGPEHQARRTCAASRGLAHGGDAVGTGSPGRVVRRRRVDARGRVVAGAGRARVARVVPPAAGCAGPEQLATGVTLGFRHTIDGRREEMIRAWMRSLAWATVLFGMAACDENTKEITTEVIPPCGPTQVQGACDTGETCFEGACVASSTLCSPTNLDGVCAAGMTCFSGGCVVASTLCGPAAPDGPCELGSTCLTGMCVPTSGLCSSTNPEGLCATGQVCIDGVCGTRGVDPCVVHTYVEQPAIVAHTIFTKKGVISVDDMLFKDSNGDGALQPYEDWRLLDECRARDLLTRMDVAQKIGLLTSGTPARTVTEDGTVSDEDRALIAEEHVRQGIIRIRNNYTPLMLARFFNALQQVAEAQPLGIPMLFVQDPSHAMSTQMFTNWPGPLGLGAIDDVSVTKAYGETVREEYRAIGYRMQYGPMADLATEPRWRRVSGTFGENAHAVARHVAACVEGFQGSRNGDVRDGIVSAVKHFPGHGAEIDGLDAHQREGRYIVFPGDNFQYHWIPFQAAFDVGARGIMPCYGIYLGQKEWDPDQVAAAFSYGLITSLAKERMGFAGLVTADWGTMGSRPWGMESLSPAQRVGMFYEAGSHQFGMEPTEPIWDAYDEGWIDDLDLDLGAGMVLETYFRLGLFENPYVEEDEVYAHVRTPALRTLGFTAQKKAIVILKNRDHALTGNNATRYLPISATRYTDADESGSPGIGEYDCDTNGDGVIRVYFDGDASGLTGSDVMDDVLDTYDYTVAAAGAGLAIETADTVASADLAVFRVSSPSGLDFDGTATAERIIDALRARDGYTTADGILLKSTNPTLKIILVETLSSPAIVKPFIDGLASLDETLGEPGSYPTLHDENIRGDGRGGVDAFLVDFGAFDRAVLDVLFNVNVPDGWTYGQARLPLEIPSSLAAVAAQLEDVPSDSANPTYDIGAGTTY
ncbi:MAG: hypothetical protein EP329_19720 [Deltaproteobacteria bacterium]|nr:MAG: hypothetical protein EP329_19720 [Deltaproteobacteria bacterium]